jgi:hypothetical protein
MSSDHWYKAVEKLAYLALLMIHDRADPSEREMACMVALSRAAIRRALDTFERHGVILVERRHRASSTYKLIVPPGVVGPRRAQIGNSQTANWANVGPSFAKSGPTGFDSSLSSSFTTSRTQQVERGRADARKPRPDRFGFEGKKARKTDHGAKTTIPSAWSAVSDFWLAIDTSAEHYQKVAKAEADGDQEQLQFLRSEREWVELKSEVMFNAMNKAGLLETDHEDQELVEHHFKEFVAHAKSNQTLSADWFSAWDIWFLRTVRWAKQDEKRDEKERERRDLRDSNRHRGIFP